MVVELELEENRKPEIQKTEFVWMNGKTIGWEDATIPIMTHALHYGTGVFEGIRGYGSGSNLLIFRLRDHFERLINSAKVCDIETKYSAEELMEACLSLIRSNDLREDCYIRPIIFVGFSGINLGFIDYPTESAIVVFPFKHYFSKPGLDVCISSWTRLFDPVTPPLAKICGNYVNSVFAKREAAKNGYDEALMLNTSGKISEGTGENIFVIKKGRMCTPPMGASILDGITRNTIMELAKEFQIEIIERDVARSELYTADEVFLTGTAAGIAPVITVDRRVVGDGKVGPLTKSLLEGYSEIVMGKLTLGHDDWVTKVY
ncbi:MAG: branched-chain amino acid transaminase [Thaumarchaeota archaeon]|nr:branched-chain amino acid transaminase [Nitrososphaerota archaeon]